VDLLVLLLAGAIILAGCGSNSSSGNSSQLPPTLSGDWQFSMGEQVNSDPTKPSFTGGLQGGFLVQTNGSITGSAIFSIATVPPGGSGGTPTQCNSGTDQITGSISNQSTDSTLGQTVTLTATSTGAQTYTLIGTLSPDGTTMTGSYTSTDGVGCGIAVTSAQPQTWTAFLVPPLTGPIQGTFLSTGGTAGLDRQNFLVSGSITQSNNVGAAYATVTGNLSFVNPATNVTDYPCMSDASLTGKISGNSVILQIGQNGSNVGQIGTPLGSVFQGVTFDSTQAGYILESLAGPSYAVYPPGCGGGNLQSPADFGNICLAVNSTTACLVPITLTPSALSFPSQALGAPAVSKTIALINTYGSTLNGVTINLTNNSGTTNFTETDTCGVDGVPSQGEPFDLEAQQSCVITIAFSPQQNCAAGSAPGNCLTATLTVASPNSDPIFTVPTAVFTVPATGGVNATASTNARSFQDVEHHAEIN
jgi:hypothetical protein